ncbi:2-succinyl-6-hydroxy-2,4-cyclohexadiene-1-carboxylate synthase [Oceanobacillus massiliensis]|uniref:2-succinyl-6-hydroxy-2, 4-cyclohexadiene-1-carboxylate synthase n=1 Tax=Oceanobacillus massiliensis TaxID=1465765 RepID=UPI00028805FC|nr:2-succinyl-6-hydroxy-2,4-cyclohexadiene-1-carboxylate synthase [Oceanobacillus massiliensis]
MYFSKGDATYWYEIHGHGIPVVLLHGFTGSTATWQDLVDEWDSDYQLITVDLPGHGKTRTPSLATMDDCCNDLDKLFQYLELKSFHMVGYSMGGRTALSFVRLYPDHILSLTLESASPGLALEEERVQRIEKDEHLATRLERDGIESFVDFWEDIPLFDSQRRLPLNVQEKIRQERLSQSPQGLAQSLRTMGTGRQPSCWEVLSTIDKPVLLIVGEFDSKFIHINKKMQNELISGNLIICEDAGHAIHVEKPAVFGKIVSGFIEANKA